MHSDLKLFFSAERKTISRVLIIVLILDLNQATIF